MNQLGAQAAIIPSSNLVVHHADCEYPFRQNSDFWYLTGFDEPNSIALFLPFKKENERYILFVQESDPSLEVWTGFRSGVKGATENYYADKAHPVDQFANYLNEYLLEAEGLSFRIGQYPLIDQIVLKAWCYQLDKSQRGELSSLSISSPSPILHKMRLIKEQYEIERIRLAASISAKAHEIARASVKPGMNEREIQGIIESYFLKENARGPAYGSIVAGGDNACVLHYTSNNSELLDGDLLLIDAGCALFDYYSGDITRTFPINGKFSPEQKDLYELVLKAQEEAINSVKPGNCAEDIHLTALRCLIDGLVELGLLIGETDSLIEQNAYKHIYMHKTGHWLGLDVHDVGASRLGDSPIALKEGMVLTVEPGVYISDRLEVPKGQPSIKDNWKGIGIRIEDNILVNSQGYEILTSEAQKSSERMECL